MKGRREKQVMRRDGDGGGGMVRWMEGWLDGWRVDKMVVMGNGERKS